MKHSHTTIFQNIFANLLLSQGFHSDDIVRIEKKASNLIKDLIGDARNNLATLDYEAYASDFTHMCDDFNERPILVPDCIQGGPRLLLERLTSGLVQVLPPKPTLDRTLADAFVHLVVHNAPK